MYFAWLGFYTNSMLYPAVIGFLLWILAESDQVKRVVTLICFCLVFFAFIHVFLFSMCILLSFFQKCRLFLRLV